MDVFMVLILTGASIAELMGVAELEAEECVESIGLV